MNLFATIEEKWQTLCKKTQPARKKLGEAGKKTSRLLKTAWAYVYKLRNLLLAAPVIIGSVWMLCMNLVKLPGEVGIHLMSDGGFFMTVPKLVAVLVPLAVTALCLLLMFLSKKPLFPWLISLFTLTLPLLILVTNVYPA